MGVASVWVGQGAGRVDMAASYHKGTSTFIGTPRIRGRYSGKKRKKISSH